MENARTVERALRLLIDLSRAPGGRTVTELARILDTQRPPLYRLLQTLEEYRMIRRDGSKRYFLSVGVVELARSVTGSLELLAGPVLQSAADRVGAGAVLVLAEGAELVAVVSASPTAGQMHIATPVGHRFPEGDIAPRLAVRALDADDRDSLVQRVRDTGVAVSQGAAIAGALAVAVPVRLGVGYGSACVMFVTLEPERRVEVEQVAVEAASELEAVFGSPSD